MLTQDYFVLRLVRLNPSEDWSLNRNALAFVLLKSGRGKFSAGPVVHRLEPGDVLYSAGESGGKLSVVNGDPLIFWCFELRLDHLYALFSGNEMSLLEGVSQSLKVPKLLSADTPLAMLCHRLIKDIPPQSNLDHRGQLLRVATSVLSEEFKSLRHHRVSSKGIDEHMVRVFEGLSADQLLQLSVGELAAKFGCGRRHLNRLFHQYFGFSVAALKMEMRLLKTVSLLRDKHAKIINVAGKCGFNHLGLFNTCFKRRFGVSPGQWRKQQLEGPVKSASRHHEKKSCPFHAKGLCPLVETPVQGVLSVSSSGSDVRVKELRRGNLFSRGPVHEI